MREDVAKKDAALADAGRAGRSDVVTLDDGQAGGVDDACRSRPRYRCNECDGEYQARPECCAEEDCKRIPGMTIRRQSAA